MRTFKIQTYRLDELEGQSLGRALAWLDECPIETENDKGEITFQYLSDDWNDGYKDDVLEHCEINDYLFAYDGTPVHRFIKENHRSENTLNWEKEFVNLYNDVSKVVTTDGDEMTDGECLDTLFDVLGKYQNKSNKQKFNFKVWDTSLKHTYKR